MSSLIKELVSVISDVKKEMNELKVLFSNELKRKKKKKKFVVEECMPISASMANRKFGTSVSTNGNCICCCKSTAMICGKELCQTGVRVAVCSNEACWVFHVQNPDVRRAVGVRDYRAGAAAQKKATMRGPTEEEQLPQNVEEMMQESENFENEERVANIDEHSNNNSSGYDEQLAVSVDAVSSLPTMTLAADDTTANTTSTDRVTRARQARKQSNPQHGTQRGRKLKKH